MSTERSCSLPRTVFPLAGLALLAFLGNVFGLNLLPGVDFLFGSIFVLLAAWRFGPLAGALAALVSSAYTIVLWGHPWALINYVAEALAVGFGRRYLNNLFLLDFLYWITFGNMQLFLLWKGLYGMDWEGVFFLVLKCDVNSLFNALTAFLVVTILPFRAFPGPKHAPDRPPLEHLLLCGMLCLAIVPLLAVMLHGTLHLDDDIESATERRRSEALRLVQRRMAQWKTPLVRALPFIAHVASEGHLSAQENPFAGTSILEVYLVSRNGTTARSFLDDTEAPPERLLPSPVLEHLQRSRAGAAPEDVAFLLCPLGKETCRAFVVATTGDSFVVLATDPTPAFDDLAEQLRTLGVQALLVDDNTGAVRPLSLFPEHLLSRLDEFRDSAGPFPLRIKPRSDRRGSIPLVHLWMRTILVDRVVYEEMPGWTMLVASPLDASGGALFGNYIRTMFLMLSMAFASIIVSFVLSRLLVRPVLRLATLTEKLSPEHAVEDWPRGVSAETEHLATNVRRMHTSLTTQFAQLRELNQNLDGAVRERTAELEETNRALEEEIAERTRVEELLRISLQDKEVLLREVHHRVKNNLQVISSLLSLQAQRAALPELAEQLREGQSRVRTMALVHDLLYRTSEFATVDMKIYLEQLVRYFGEVSLPRDTEVTIVTSVDATALSVDKAIPCGLVAGELLMNACKHGFSGTKKGTITVSLRSAKAEATLSVSNDGAPLREDYAGGATGLGMTIVEALVRQLDGTLRVRTATPVVFEIRFPL